ncbi:glycosyltransferase family 4 protein [bacterium]|nr:glycosyltransferase family 4 protein [bacterium]
MKGVLVLTPFFRPNVGGVETHLSDICEYLRKHDFKIHIITYQPLTTKAQGLRVEKKENLEVRRFSWFGYNWFPRLEKIPLAVFLYLAPGLLFYSVLFLLRNRKKIDVIHTHGLNAAFVGLIGSKIFHKKFIISLHTIYRLRQRPFVAFFVKSILRHTDMVLALGETGRKDLVDVGLESKKVKKYTYSVNHELFKPLDKKFCRKKLKLPLDRFIALFVGRFVAQKGIKVLTESIKYAHPDILFIFAGEGPDEKYIRKISVNFKNVLLCGNISNDELVYYYSAADCFSWGSVDADYIGKVCIESLLCGLPVIAPNELKLFGITKRVNPSVLPEGVGFLIEPGAKTLAEKLNFLLKNRHILEKMRANCRKFARGNYGLKNIDLIIKSYLEEN